jgi:hypothetical protein
MKTKLLLLITTIIFLSSCQKEYICVCTAISTGQECTFEKEKTTNLGKKGMKKACQNHPTTNADLKDCDLR